MISFVIVWCNTYAKIGIRLIENNRQQRYMRNSVKNFLKEHNLLQKGKIFVVGFSGGYDSMCLLDILNKLSLEYGFSLIALHLNHNWRGDEARKEQQNCENFCKLNNLKFVTETLSEEIPKTETAAREQRQKFFKKYYHEFNADGLFLAHTKSDNTETILYRIAKGTGVKGLCGILSSSTNDFCKIFRPLMKFSREDILSYCEENNLNPNNDSSNENTDYTRNYIRHEVVPKLKKLNDNIDEAVLSLANIAISEQNIINEYLEKIKKEIIQNNIIQTQRFIELSRDIQNKFIVNFLIDNGLDYDYKKVQEIYEFVQFAANLTSGKTYSLAKDLWLFVSKEKICTTTKTESSENSIEIKIDKCGEYRFGNKIFSIKEYKSDLKVKFPKENELKAYVCLKDNFSMTLRTRREGDKIYPIGLGGSMKMKKLFINKGIEKFARNDILLLCEDDEVLWAAGVCLSEKIKVSNLPTHVLMIENK